jgi:tetratricopeptide (TPR) repeat protein
MKLVPPHSVPRQVALVALIVTVSICASGQESAIESRFRHGTEAMRNGSLDEAASDFQAVIHSSPRFAEAYLNLGLVRQQQGRYEEAIKIFQQALRLKPTLRGANLFLGLAHYRLNHYEPAIAALRSETKQSPSDAKAWMWLGVVALEADHPEQAAAALDKAAKLAPQDVDILYHRGRAHALISKESYEHMFKADPHSWRVQLILAQASAEAGRDIDAIAEYQAAIKLAPSEPGLHENLGSELWKVSRFEDAQTAYQQELQIDPNNVLALYKLGVLKVLGLKASEGKHYLEEALRRDPTLGNAYYYLGRAELQLNNHEAALKDFEQVAKINAESQLTRQAYYQMAQLYREMHRTDEAGKALATFQKLKEEADQQEQQILEHKRQRLNQSVENLPSPAKKEEPVEPRN